ncbi:hypothetical protein [uncultured Ruminococcus sp.]|nr:hypothetical protein [uncultured Ruminococcus sp.]
MTNPAFRKSLIALRTIAGDSFMSPAIVFYYDFSGTLTGEYRQTSG